MVIAASGAAACRVASSRNGGPQGNHISQGTPQD